MDLIDAYGLVYLDYTYIHIFGGVAFLYYDWYTLFRVCFEGQEKIFMSVDTYKLSGDATSKSVTGQSYIHLGLALLDMAGDQIVQG